MPIESHSSRMPCAARAQITWSSSACDDVTNTMLLATGNNRVSIDRLESYAFATGRAATSPRGLLAVVMVLRGEIY